MFNYNDFLFFIPVYGNIPWTSLTIWLAYNLFMLGFVFYFILWLLKNQKYYKNGFLRKNTVYLIGGKMWDWKTRFMTKTAKDIKESNKNIIVCSNYMNWYTDIFFSSKKDLFYLQKDIQTLWLTLNFNWEEKKQIEKAFWWYFNFDEETLKFKSKLSKIKAIGQKINLLTLGDEFYAYLHNRKAMKNFSGIDWEKLLEMLHQTRHSNQLLLLSSQDTDNLDLDLRQIADKEIEVKERLFGLFYWFNLYYYLNLKYQNKNDNMYFQKINRFPFVFFNWYLLYQFIEFINSTILRSEKVIFKIINKVFRKNLYKTFIFWNYFEKNKLDYNTKFNVNVNISVYKAGYLFDFILEKYKNMIIE